MRYTWLYSLLLFVVCLPAFGQQKIRPDNQIAWPPTCTTPSYVYSPQLNACIAGGPPGPPGSTTTGIDVTTRGADPTGLTDSSSVFTSTCTGNPNGTLFMPQGTYLLAATSSLTLSSNCNLFFANGAQVKTGNQGAATISTIQRVASYAGSYTVSLAGCTSSSSAVANTETFTSCPNTLSNANIVVLTGLTNVVNCYQGCDITAQTGTSFTVSNVNATTVVAGTETGSAISQTGNVTLSLATLGCQSASTVSPGIITISSCANAFPAFPIIITLAGTTNVHAGTYVAIPSSITSTGFQLVCPTGCTSIATGAETGTAGYLSGGQTYVHFSAPLTGVPAAGWLSAANTGASNGLGQIICTGTTNYNGPYWITAVADSQDIALLDPRASAAQETAGNCFIPYTFTALGSTQAAPFQQIVAHNSAVSFQGTGTNYVGWYGAQGPTGSNDWLSFQEDLFWNPSKIVKAPKVAAPVYGFGVVAHTDYNIGDSLQLYGNAQELDGEVAGLWEGGTVLNCTGSGPCVITRPDTATPKLGWLNIYGQSCAGGLAAVTLFKANTISNDGWLSASGQMRGEQVYVRCMGRDGVRIESAGGAFNTTIYGRGEPDYWRITSLRTNSNRGYGLSCFGTDCNAGHLDGMSDFASNTYGGAIDAGESTSLADGFGSEGNSGAIVAGATNNITALTVNTPGAYNTTCTATFASLPAGFVTGAWLIIAGTTGSGGLAGVDNGTGPPAGFPTDAWQIVSTATNTATFNCPGATGGPGSTGTAKTSDSVSVYNTIQVYPNGYSNSPWNIVGAYGGIWQITNPYTEVTNGCPSNSGIQFGGNNAALVTAQSCNGTIGVSSFGTFVGPALFGNGNGGVTEIAGGHTIQSQQPVNLSLNLINGITSGLHGATLPNNTAINFMAGSNVTTDWTLEEGIGGTFLLADLGSGINPLFISPTANEFFISGPTSSSVIWFNHTATATGNINFYNVAGTNTTIATTGITTPSLTCTGSPCGTGAPLNAPAWLTFLGDGTDGALNITSGTTSVFGEKWYTTVNVSAGATMNNTSTSTTIIRATGTCTIAGTISLSPNTGGSVGNNGFGTIGGTGGGGGGGTAAGTAATGVNSLFASTAGGTAGAASGGTGGNGNNIGISQQRGWMSVGGTAGTSTTSLLGGAGTPGGGGGSSGGAGGKGGGQLVLACQTINFTGTIDISGQAGTAAPGNNTGGGGGGGGGDLIEAAVTYTANTGTITKTGGAAGTCGAFTGCGAGGTGGAGNNYVFTLP